MKKQEQIWLAILALIALILWSRRRQAVTLATANDPVNYLPLSTTALPVDTWDAIISMQHPQVSIGY